MLQNIGRETVKVSHIASSPNYIEIPGAFHLFSNTPTGATGGGGGGYSICGGDSLTHVSFFKWGGGGVL